MFPIIALFAICQQPKAPDSQTRRRTRFFDYPRERQAIVAGRMSIVIGRASLRQIWPFEMAPPIPSDGAENLPARNRSGRYGWCKRRQKPKNSSERSETFRMRYVSPERATRQLGVCDNANLFLRPTMSFRPLLLYGLHTWYVGATARHF